MSRGAVCTGQPRLRVVAGHKVSVVLRARCASRRARAEGAQGQVDPLHGRDAGVRRSHLPLGAGAHGAARRVGCAPAASRRRWAVDARRPANRARPEAEGAQAPARCGAVVSRSLRVELPEGGHTHTSELLRYDQAYPEPLDGGGVDKLVAAGVRAAVVAPEREVPLKWFSWKWLFANDLVERLVSEGRLERPAPGWLTAPTSE